MSIESYIMAKYPIAYDKLGEAVLGDKKSRMELMMSIYDDITYTLANIPVYEPPPNGKVSYLTTDVNFKAFLQEYVIVYAVKLLDYLKSYTVQLHSSGTMYDVSNKGQSSIQLNDLFTGDLHRHVSLDEYIFTGKYPWYNSTSHSISSPYYDSERVGNTFHNSTHERLLDEVQITLRNAMVNHKPTMYKNSLNFYVPDTVPQNLSDMDATGGYDRYDNSINLKEELYCRVVSKTSKTDSAYPIYKDNTVISVVGGPVLISKAHQKTTIND